MKYYFNRRPVAGPWGGGSKVLSSIIEECTSRGHEVFFEEEVNLNIDFDIIFCMDPRPNNFTGFIDLLNKKRFLPKCKLIQRIGDLGTHGKPDLFELVKIASCHSDVLVFPSNWAKNYLNSQNKNCYVIPNAPLQDFIIETNTIKNYDTLKIVSHHWSNNSMKGFEIYKSLDNYCDGTKSKFTFIGRKPEDVYLKNYILPQDILGLKEEIPKHNVYITASKQEAGANHVLEAMALGLPVLYHEDGGSINEYCKDFGLSYNSFESLIDILKNGKDELKKISEKISYKRNSKDMAREYVNLFEECLLI